ncbi:hypothetical protein JQ634_03830 [Bradyrhizobium sp. AUGA SZCCT0240]|uniref:hypothetical protein n=1 Tax=unclassified Bradyrhizobium TaxID=2631580 RepID=UPI001BA86505|nr:MULTISPECIES: hypothetical protein [unclassified Bradyrhizobium]MBR1192060.1 hypothetical protein [Bradyrhizobium sp. AUGA SZCCT0160]MBR1194432.1 hypothetical protein [Bradyrhizobium sp. AUGA SZCCT0158]MBR1245104.1 hypothetical protein [Bradyrhizobium sp. AUGA SZCCT0274]MBR1252824.1 hypothetical protein [Bradyrhizobium sp. AUGA SZCCT0240]
MFIVRGKSDLVGDTELVRDTPADAIETANDLLAQGCVQVTIEADGRVYTMAEFAIDPGIRCPAGGHKNSPAQGRAIGRKSINSGSAMPEEYFFGRDPVNSLAHTALSQNRELVAMICIGGSCDRNGQTT